MKTRDLMAEIATRPPVGEFLPLYFTIPRWTRYWACLSRPEGNLNIGVGAIVMLDELGKGRVLCPACSPTGYRTVTTANNRLNG